MEAAFYIKATLVVIQWFALGLQIGFGKAKDNYKHLLGLTDDAKSRKFLNEKIGNANTTEVVCRSIVLGIMLIVFLL